MITIRLFGAVDVRDGRGDVLHELLRQPKRLALLAYVAAEGELDFLGRDEVLGITLPTSEDTDDKAIAGFGIYGFHKGILGGGEVDPTSGSLTRLAELVSIERP